MKAVRLGHEKVGFVALVLFSDFAGLRIDASLVAWASRGGIGATAAESVSAGAGGIRSGQQFGDDSFENVRHGAFCDRDDGDGGGLEGNCFHESAGRIREPEGLY